MRIAVIDDERLARRRLKRLVGAVTGIEVVGEAADGPSAVDCIQKTRPDVVLLDIQMPEHDGFTVLRSLRPPLPLVIFVTAHDEFAVDAFDVHAVDYLLKPISRDRLVAALGRARERLARPAEMQAALAALRDLADRQARAADRLPVRSQGRIDFVDVAAIDWIEAADNYVVIHTGRRTHILRETLSGLEGRLDPRLFVRIHRSTIVRVDRIVRLIVALRGDYDVVLADGATLTLSRTHRGRLKRALGRKI